MKLSLKNILIERGYWGHNMTLPDAGEKKTKDLEGPEEFPEVFGGPCKAKIKNNHGHVLEIPRHDLEDEDQREYNIRGSSNHNHTVTLEKEDFEKLESKGKLIIRSSKDNGHDHVVIISCS